MVTCKDVTLAKRERMSCHIKKKKKKNRLKYHRREESKNKTDSKRS